MTIAARPDAFEAIRAALPPDRERDVAAYAIDGVTPGFAARPETRDEVAALLAAADAAGHVVVPQGARSALRLGRPLEAYDIALDTTGLDRIVAYEPEDLTITVEAGVRLEALQAVLGARGQYLPVDAPPDDRVTIGGLLATARPGAWRGHVPAARDLVLGATVATAEGALVASGGRVVKNVSGYDMHRLHTGALGAFGVIVEASFKLAPLPPLTRTVALRCANVEQASELAFALWDQALPLRLLSLLSAEAARAAGLAPAPHVLVECVGTEAAIKRCTAEVHRQAVLFHVEAAAPVGPEPAAALRALAGAEAGVALRLTVPASEVAATIDAATEAGAAAWGHLASGAVLAVADDLDAPTARRLRAHAEAVRGTLQIDAASAELRRAVEPVAAGDADLVRRLRGQFDPHGTINRGRWMDGL